MKLDQIKMILIPDNLIGQLLKKRVQLQKSYLIFSCPIIKYS